MVLERNLSESDEAALEVEIFTDVALITGRLLEVHPGAVRIACEIPFREGSFCWIVLPPVAPGASVTQCGGQVTRCDGHQMIVELDDLSEAAQAALGALAASPPARLPRN